MTTLLRMFCLIVALALAPVHAASMRMPVVAAGLSAHAGMDGMDDGKCGSAPCPNRMPAQPDCCSPSLPALPAAMPVTVMPLLPPAVAAVAALPAGRTWAPPERPPRA